MQLFSKVMHECPVLGMATHLDLHESLPGFCVGCDHDLNTGNKSHRIVRVNVWGKKHGLGKNLCVSSKCMEQKAWSGQVSMRFCLHSSLQLL